jgi:hypothetical protein
LLNLDPQLYFIAKFLYEATTGGEQDLLLGRTTGKKPSKISNRLSLNSSTGTSKFK